MPTETYTAVTTVECLPEKPVKTSLMLRFRANLLAVLQGASSAPRIEPAALSTYALGPNETYATGDGGVIGQMKAHIGGELTGGGSGICSVVFRYRTSTDGGSTWTGYTEFFGPAVGASSTATIPMFHNQTFNLPAGTNAVETDVVETLPGGGSTDYAASYFLNGTL